MGIGTTIRSVAKDVVGPRVLPLLPERVDLPLDGFGLSVGDSGHLHLGQHDLVELTQRFGSPLHVVDGDRLTRAADDALSPVGDDATPGCDIFYSYKTNPVPAVLRRLHDRGIGAEVISEYELWLALHLGVPGERIIYNGPAKSAESIDVAIENEVMAINANSGSDARRIVAAANRLGKRVNLGVRVAVAGAWAGQFGMAPDVDRVAALIEELRADSMTDLMCFHAHRGGSIRGTDDVKAHFGSVIDFVGQLHERTGWSPDVVDFGGSLSSPTVAGFGNRTFRLNRFLGSDLLPPDPSTAATIAEASQIGATMLQDWASSVGVDTPRGVLEPGRSLTSDTQFLLTTVVDVKTDTEPTHVVVDAGINVAEAASSEYHQLYSASAPTGEASESVRIAGPICTPADVLYNNWELPPLEDGHVLAIMDSGAYFVPFSTSFSFSRPAIVMRDGDQVEVAREAESFSDIIRLDR